MIGPSKKALKRMAIALPIAILLLGAGWSSSAAKLPQERIGADSLAVATLERVKWEGRDLARFFALVSKLGSDNVVIMFDVETSLLWVYGPGESIAKGGGGTPFNFALTCPPNPPEDCDPG